MVDEEHKTWTDSEAIAYHDACLRAALHGLQWQRTRQSQATCFTVAALRALASGITPTTSTPLLGADDRHKYVLFFDGGSRGKPEPGGAGAVVVQVPNTGTASKVIWTASMSYQAPTTTNNEAEYAGLLTGLQAAKKHGSTPLEVVGDSQLLLNQMKTYKALRRVTLRSVYAKARRLGDALGVTRWLHHPIAFNSMADAAANVAMDTAASCQVHHPASRLDHDGVLEFLALDIGNWHETSLV